MVSQTSIHRTRRTSCPLGCVEVKVLLKSVVLVCGAVEVRVVEVSVVDVSVYKVSIDEVQCS